MNDPWIRTLVVLAVIGIPMAAAWWAGRARRPWVGQMPRELGPFPRVLLFTSRSCPTCPPASEVVHRIGGDGVRELTWPADTVSFHKLGVGQVPSTFVVARGGKVVQTFEGVPEERALARAVKRAGL